MSEIEMTEVEQPVQRSNSSEVRGIEDVETPFGDFLRGRYKRSYAYLTIKDRLPVTLTNIIDRLSRNKDFLSKFHGPAVCDDIKRVIGSISELKNRLVTNKEILPLPLLHMRDNEALLWNERLEELIQEKNEVQTWFSTVWLFCECYMYRSIAQEFAFTKSLSTYDVFWDQKQESYFAALNNIISLSTYTMNLVRSNQELNEEDKKSLFIKFLKLSLWGNKSDLSHSCGRVNVVAEDQFNFMESLDTNILINNCEDLWDILNSECKNDENGIVDIVLDNAGYELFTDLCLATFLIHQKLAKKIRLYIKRLPWFVSDAMEKDLMWIIERMSEEENEDVKCFGNLCKKYLKVESWIVESDNFWTRPYDFSQMRSKSPQLYDKLSEAILIVFKGDLNYRKLLGDINWKHSTSFTKSLRGFRPSNLVSLRTLKADLCVGLERGKSDELDKRDGNWMINGNYGLIQLSKSSESEVDEDVMESEETENSGLVNEIEKENSEVRTNELVNEVANGAIKDSEVISDETSLNENRNDKEQSEQVEHDDISENKMVEDQIESSKEKDDQMLQSNEIVDEPMEDVETKNVQPNNDQQESGKNNVLEMKIDESKNGEIDKLQKNDEIKTDENIVIATENGNM